MAQFFEEEKGIPDNRQRANFVFFAYPYTPPIAADDYKNVLKELEEELSLRLWYFLDEVTTEELMRKIWRAILRCDLAIFDVSGGNPNVAFELGLAVAVNRPSITLLKQGAPNPLGNADLGYSERAEYTSAATLKEQLRKLLLAKTTAARKIKDASYQIYDSSVPKTHDQLQGHIREILKHIYKTKRITKKQATTIFGEYWLADKALQKLREMDVLQVEGQRRGARWVFSGSWVYHDHEVAGV